MEFCGLSPITISAASEHELSKAKLKIPGKKGEAPQQDGSNSEPPELRRRLNLCYSIKLQWSAQYLMTKGERIGGQPALARLQTTMFTLS
ncbi:hypothetical protein VTG60DRAFT_3333 [Thermothelomyces hinnuleus]